MSRCRTLAVAVLAIGAAMPVSGALAATRHFGDRTLRQGMHGHDVKVLQDFLSRVGVRTTIDGQFGPTTNSHVRVWQRRSSLLINGTVSRREAAILRGQVHDGQTLLDSAQAGAQAAPGPVRAAPAPAPAGPAAGQPAADNPSARATLAPDGTATAPASAPAAVQSVVAAANRIVTKPYRYGGGHATWEDTGYDCSGSVSYALHGANLVTRPLDSTDFMSWAVSGPGAWISVYANSGHAYMVVAGLRFDTGYHDTSSSGPRWSATMRPSSGYTVRHPAGL